MSIKLNMLKSAASSSGAATIRIFLRITAGYLNVLKGELPSRALAESDKQCLMFTNQFTILKGHLSV